MGEKDVQWGVLILIAAVFFLMSGLDMLKFRLVERDFSNVLAFMLGIVAIYLITKK